MINGMALENRNKSSNVNDGHQMRLPFGRGSIECSI